MSVVLLADELNACSGELTEVLPRPMVKIGNDAFMFTYADNILTYVLLLTGNFADEILAQQQTYHHRGGRFIISIPETRVLKLSLLTSAT